MSKVPVTQILTTLPKEKGFIQELFGADVMQWKVSVDDQEQSAEDGNRLQALQARLPARQRPWARLLQPIGVCLETEEWSFVEGVKAWR